MLIMWGSHLFCALCCISLARQGGKGGIGGGGHRPTAATSGCQNHDLLQYGRGKGMPLLLLLQTQCSRHPLSQRDISAQVRSRQEATLVARTRIISAESFSILHGEFNYRCGVRIPCKHLSNISRFQEALRKKYPFGFLISPAHGSRCFLGLILDPLPPVLCVNVRECCVYPSIASIGGQGGEVGFPICMRRRPNAGERVC